MATAFHRIDSDFRADRAQNIICLNAVLKRNTAKGKRCYQQVCQVVDRLQCQFEWIFLVQVVYTFIGIISTTFHIMKGTESWNELQNLILWNVEAILRLWFLCYIPDRIRNNVAN